MEKHFYIAKLNGKHRFLVVEADSLKQAVQDAEAWAKDQGMICVEVWLAVGAIARHSVQYRAPMETRCAPAKPILTNAIAGEGPQGGVRPH